MLSRNFPNWIVGITASVIRRLHLPIQTDFYVPRTPYPICSASSVIGCLWFLCLIVFLMSGTRSKNKFCL